MIYRISLLLDLYRFNRPNSQVKPIWSPIRALFRLSIAHDLNCKDHIETNGLGDDMVCCLLCHQGHFKLNQNFLISCTRYFIMARFLGKIVFTQKFYWLFKTFWTAVYLFMIGFFFFYYCWISFRSSLICPLHWRPSVRRSAMRAALILPTVCVLCVSVLEKPFCRYFFRINV